MPSAFEGLVGGLMDKLRGTPALEGLIGKVEPALTSLLSGGGLQKLVTQFKEAGFVRQAESWVGKGENEPITADQVKQALSAEQLTQVAEQLGVSQDEAAAALAESLPKAVDHLTPEGTLPAEVDQTLLAGTR